MLGGCPLSGRGTWLRTSPQALLGAPLWAVPGLEARRSRLPRACPPVPQSLRGATPGRLVPLLFLLRLPEAVRKVGNPEGDPGPAPDPPRT